jgi:hypothetical protein
MVGWLAKGTEAPFAANIAANDPRTLPRAAGSRRRQIRKYRTRSKFESVRLRVAAAWTQASHSGSFRSTPFLLTIHHLQAARIAAWAGTRRALPVADLLPDDVGVPAVLSEFAQHVKVHPAEREWPEPVAVDLVV